jgi:dTDP-4-dehydrorhamnose 3,5-epimerase
MKFHQTKLEGAYVIEPSPICDERGSFSRLTCDDEFRKYGLVDRYVQTSLSANNVTGTLRGMHLQVPPHSETKLVSCFSGSIFDVIADLRPHSTTFGEWFGAELNASNMHTMYVPEGFAHGFITLENNSNVYYQMSKRYSPDHAHGFQWNDPEIGIEWPVEPVAISEKDTLLPAHSSLFEKLEPHN